MRTEYNAIITPELFGINSTRYETRRIFINTAQRDVNELRYFIVYGKNRIGFIVYGTIDYYHSAIMINDFRFKILLNNYYDLTELRF